MKKLIQLLRSERCLRYILSCVMGLIFIIAGIMKVVDPLAFYEDVMRYRLIPEGWNIYLAAALPWLELMIGVAVFIRYFRLAASIVISSLMGVFTLAIASALARGLDISCGCFGKAFRDYAPAGISFFLRDCILFSISIALVWLIIRSENANGKISV